MIVINKENFRRGLNKLNIVIDKPYKKCLQNNVFDKRRIRFSMNNNSENVNEIKKFSFAYRLPSEFKSCLENVKL